jgi:putative CocE/NonD family hydrolase
MFGISWGGFSALQVAARRPPALKAVISLCSTDDRYALDVHYMGGCLLAHMGLVSWASSMLAFNARPPDPSIVGERWRAMWLDRLENTPAFAEAWLAHQHQDDYWRHGSVREDYDAIECPVFMVGGWADAYRTAILRFLAGFSGPRKGLIGPWGHQFPEAGVPGPAIGFLQEAVRWWDHWLKGADTGLMDEPMLRVWMQEAIEPRATYALRPGRWVAEETWPSTNVETHVTALEFPQAEVAGSLRTGFASGDWCARLRTDLPTDQRADDAHSLVHTSAPLEERLEILGLPEVDLYLSADRPRALVAVRLCDVAPNGESTLITRGLFNLTHHFGDHRPQPLVPDEPFWVKVSMDAIAYALPPGHRLRVAVSPDYVTWAWPSPEPVTLRIAEARLRLPVRPPRPADDELPPFGEPESAPALEHEILTRSVQIRRVTYDDVRRTIVAELHVPITLQRLPGTGIEFGVDELDRYSLVEGDPLSTKTEVERTVVMRRGDWSVRIEGRTTLTSDFDALHLTNALDAYEGERRVFSRAKATRIPRDGI